MIKALEKRLLRPIINSVYKKNHALIIAGMGRCGTTLMVNSLVKNHYFISTDFTTRLKNMSFKKGYLYKSHDYPPRTLKKHVKVIYMFGNPMNTALSAHRRINEWGAEHHEHLVSDLFEYNDSVIYQDTLRLKDNFLSWYKPQGFSFITIKYEELYNADVLANLSKYLGHDVKLLPQKQRFTDWHQSKFRDQLLNTYGDLQNMISMAESSKIWDST